MKSERVTCDVCGSDVAQSWYNYHMRTYHPEHRDQQEEEPKPAEDNPGKTVLHMEDGTITLTTDFYFKLHEESVRAAFLRGVRSTQNAFMSSLEPKYTYQTIGEMQVFMRRAAESVIEADKLRNKQQ